MTFTYNKPIQWAVSSQYGAFLATALVTLVFRQLSFPKDLKASSSHIVEVFWLVRTGVRYRPLRSPQMSETYFLLKAKFFILNCSQKWPKKNFFSSCLRFLRAWRTQITWNPIFSTLIWAKCLIVPKSHTCMILPYVTAIWRVKSFSMLFSVLHHYSSSAVMDKDKSGGWQQWWVEDKRFCVQ